MRTGFNESSRRCTSSESPPTGTEKTARQLAEYTPRTRLIEEFRATPPTNTADFCLEMYRRMGLLEGVTVARSSDPAFRAAACDIADFYVDVPYENETVRDRVGPHGFLLHGGGDSWITLPPSLFTKKNISPARDTRLRWMTSVIHCTHYVAGAGEQAYLNKTDAPDVVFVSRDTIERSNEAWTE